MAWKSSTFNGNSGAKSSKTGDIQEAKERHKTAIKKLVDQAQELATDSAQKLKNIKDPVLRRSVQR